MAKASKAAAAPGPPASPELIAALQDIADKLAALRVEVQDFRAAAREIVDAIHRANQVMHDTRTLT